MRKLPRYWRRFKRLMTVQDLLTNRKVLVKTTENGVEKIRIKRAKTA